MSSSVTTRARDLGVQSSIHTMSDHYQLGVNTLRNWFNNRPEVFDALCRDYARTQTLGEHVTGVTLVESKHYWKVELRNEYGDLNHFFTWDISQALTLLQNPDYKTSARIANAYVFSDGANPDVLVKEV